MSRTYRFKHDKWKIDSDCVLMEWEYIKDFYHSEEDYEIKLYNKFGITGYYKIIFSTKSKEGKRRLAKFRSDAKWRYWDHVGPGWFHNLYSQRPYRRDAKRQIKRYIDNDIDVELLRKPKREYWD